jgi:hypothetical protein
MLFDRILGALEFRRGIYAQVEEDASFTTTAWLLVIVSAFLNQLGSQASGNLINWLISAVTGTITAVIGFAVAAYLMDWIGRTLFGADVSFDELVRTLGLAYIWSAVGVLGIVARLFAPLNCLVAPTRLAAAILLVVAWFVAAREALDMEWGRTIVTVGLGWIVLVAIMIVTNVVLDLLGIGAGALGGLVGF